jgi:hypothetical protein
MFKRSWPAAILAGGLLATIAAPPLYATEESNFEIRTARISRGVDTPHTPGDRAPISTPTGDDDMPNREIRPRSPSVPLAEATASVEDGRRAWLRSLSEWWMELRSRRFAVRF